MFLSDDSKKLSKVKVTGKRLEYNKLQLYLKEKRKNRKSRNNEKVITIVRCFKKSWFCHLESPIDKLHQDTLLLLGTGTLISALPPLVSKVKKCF